MKSAATLFVLSLLTAPLSTLVAQEPFKPVAELVTPPQLAESQLWHINAKGDAVGRCEIYDAASASIADFGCIATQGNFLAVPKLPGYRRMECVAISDTGVVVGHAYSPVTTSDSAALQAISFDIAENSPQPLPSLEVQTSSIATSISASGEWVVGVCQGKACVWSRKDKTPVVQRLPVTQPDAVSRHVVISDDGRIAAAAVRNRQQVQLMLWRRDKSDSWQAEVRLEADLAPLDINNAGVIVGNKAVLAGRITETRGFVLFPDQVVRLISPIEGDNFTTARSINNQNVVVGWSDAEGDGEKGPRGFYWRNDQLSTLPIEETLISGHQAFAINDRGDVVGLCERIADTHCVGFKLPLRQLLREGAEE